MTQVIIQNKYGEQIDISSKEKRVRVFHHDIGKSVQVSIDPATPDEILLAFLIKGLLVRMNVCSSIRQYQRCNRPPSITESRLPKSRF